ncbi:unnamed protein product [Phytophthora lilii]|uniref:Unnamed protein product n=1 Tax=Phytophthora lilii TaxID=2077276 RepID=A0A9W6WR05_9STRA|nr:unnamed protein product [Phytophthora lilii]
MAAVSTAAEGSSLTAVADHADRIVLMSARVGCRECVAVGGDILAHVQKLIDRYLDTFSTKENALLDACSAGASKKALEYLYSRAFEGPRRMAVHVQTTTVKSAIPLKHPPIGTSSTSPLDATKALSGITDSLSGITDSMHQPSTSTFKSTDSGKQAYASEPAGGKSVTATRPKTGTQSKVLVLLVGLRANAEVMLM